MSLDVKTYLWNRCLHLTDAEQAESRTPEWVCNGNQLRSGMVLDLCLGTYYHDREGYHPDEARGFAEAFVKLRSLTWRTEYGFLGSRVKSFAAHALVELPGGEVRDLLETRQRYGSHYAVAFAPWVRPYVEKCCYDGQMKQRERDLFLVCLVMDDPKALAERMRQVQAARKKYAEAVEFARRYEQEHAEEIARAQAELDRQRRAQDEAIRDVERLFRQM